MIYPANKPADSVDALIAAYAYPEGQRWVRANMISSLDGAAQGVDGRSGSLGTDADRRVMALLRGLADVVLVGAGTVRTEGYGPVDYVPEYAELRQAHGGSATAPIAVVSRSLDLDPAEVLFAAAEQRTIVITVESAPAHRRRALAEVADVVVAGSTSIEVDAALQSLASRGLTRVLCEGGPVLLSDIVRCDGLDELCLTISPATMGGTKPRIIDGVDTYAHHWTLGHVIEDSSMLLTRWTRGQPVSDEIKELRTT